MTEKRFAILIASSKYPDEPGLIELRCPENDVDTLNEVLRSPDFGRFTETFVLKNAPSHEVLEKIETVLADAGREDLVLIYFSGHGKLNSSNQLCLAAANTKLKAVGSTSIPVERIKSFFDTADTKKKILILDCCYSGAAGKDFAKGGIDDQLQLMSGGQGTFIMTASTGIQAAFEKEGDSLGLFTKHLVEGIRSGAADSDEDGLIDIHELYGYVHEKVRAEGKQEPMKCDLHAKGKMIIARSGKDARENRRQELRTKLCGLAAQGYLSDRLLGESLKIASMSAQEMTARDRECSLLIEQLVDERLSPADFVESWMKTSFVPEKLPVPTLPAQKSKIVIAAIAVASVCAALAVVAVLNQDVKPLPDNPPLTPSGTTIGQYIDHGDGTITDTKSGLMWKRCPEGLSGGNCEEGKTEKYKWDEAVQRFKNVKHAKYSDWRLPTIDELKTLVQCSKGKDKNNDLCNKGSAQPTINQQAFPKNTEFVFWSGSPSANDSGYAWYVAFLKGNSNFINRDSSYAVRLVRGGQ